MFSDLKEVEKYHQVFTSRIYKFEILVYVNTDRKINK